MRIRFGPSGNSDAFYEQGYKHTWQAFEWLRGMNLDAYEYSFGRGVRITQPTANTIGENARKYDIAMSVHAPYFINLVTQDEEKQKKNVGYIMDSVRAADWMGADRVVVHPGSTKGIDRNDAMQWAMENWRQVLEIKADAGYDHILLCPETMGKINQFGDLQEVLNLCAMDSVTVPTIDFGHLNARTLGGLATRADYAAVLDAIGERLGPQRLSTMHCHFSRIEFTKQGEKRHWTFADEQYGPEFAPLAKELASRDLTPRMICESKGTMAQDAASMQAMYLACVEGKD